MLIPGITRVGLILLVLPLLMLISYVLTPITVHSVNRGKNMEYSTLSICVYSHSCVNPVILNMSSKLVNAYNYHNVTFILFGGMLQLLRSNLVRHCDVIVGLSNLLTYVLLKKGVIKAKFIGIGFQRIGIPYSLTLMYAIPYSYKVLKLNSNNITEYVEKIIINELLGKEPIKNSPSDNYGNKTLLVYEVLVIQNNIPRELLKDLLSLVSIARRCNSLGELDSKIPVENMVSQLELLRTLRRIIRSNAYATAMGDIDNDN